MLQLFSAGRHVEDDRAVPGAEVPRELLGDLRVAADKIRTHGLVVLERNEPVGIAMIRLISLGQPLVPYRVGDFRRELTRELPFTILREAGAGDLPGVR